MRLIKSYSPELREIKEQAIINMDKPLLKDLQEINGEEFILVDSFLDLLMATSLEVEKPLIQTTSFKESFLKPVQS